jgi:hypothetical protein
VIKVDKKSKLQIFEEGESNYCNFKLNKQQTIRKHLFFRQKGSPTVLLTNETSSHEVHKASVWHNITVTLHPNLGIIHHIITLMKDTCSQNRLDLQLI